MESDKENNIEESEERFRHRIDAEAIDFLYKRIPAIWIVNMLIGLLFVIGIWGRIPPVHLLVWFAFFTLSLGYRFNLFFRYKRDPNRRGTPQRWKHRYAFSALLQGCTWGYAGFFFFVPDSSGHQVLLFSLIISISVASIMAAAYVPSAFYPFSVVATGCMGARMLIEGGTEFYALAAAVVVYNFLGSQFVNRANQMARESIRLRFENLELVEELKEANMAKTRFLASASHDLRQPVHSLALFHETLSEEVHNERGRQLMDHMREAIGGIRQLLDSLLDISRLDANTVKPHPCQVSIDVILKPLISELRPLAEEKGISLRHRRCNWIVESDPVLLGNILRNLIGNAIRYTDRGGVLVACRPSKGVLRVEIWDSGRGIPAENQEEIFREFSQLHNPERDRSKGLGLGLAICKRLAELLDHPLSVQSIPRRGSRFILEIPTLMGRGQLKESGALQPQSQPLWNLKEKTVLVVDDEVSVRKAMESLLSGWGVNVLLAEGVEGALEHGAENNYTFDAIVADYRLREHTTGAQVIETLRQRAGQTIPALLITGETDPEQLRTINKGDFDILNKPLKPGELRCVLGQLVSQS